jgi:hypothetical protein
MAYLSALLRQSGARVGSSQPSARPAGIEVDDVRVVPPRPAAAPERAPAAPVPESGEPAPAERPAAPASTPAPLERPRERPAPLDSSPPHSEPAAPVAGPPPAVPAVVGPAVAEPLASAETPPTTFPVVPSTRRREPTITPRPPADAHGPPAEEHVLRQVAEVVAWVAAGSEAEESASAPAGVALRPARLEVREAAPARAVEAQPVPREAPSPERGDVSVSVGTIELTVEAPAGLAVPVLPVPASAPSRDEPSGVSGLTRHYLHL